MVLSARQVTDELRRRADAVAHGQFLTGLDAHMLSEHIDEGPYWLLLAPLVYWPAGWADAIGPGAGFTTNFASVPRKWYLALIYWLFGGIANAPAALHDWLYTEARYPREVCDALFREAIYASMRPDRPDWAVEYLRKPARDFIYGGKWLYVVRPFCSVIRYRVGCLRVWLLAWAMWSGVRIGGTGHYGSRA